MEVQASLIQLGGKGVPKQKKPRVYRHPNASTSVQKSIKHLLPQEILKQRRTKLVQALTHIQHIYIYIYTIYIIHLDVVRGYQLVKGFAGLHMYLQSNRILLRRLESNSNCQFRVRTL